MKAKTSLFAGIKCHGCHKNPPVTSNNRGSQPLCSNCNMLLRRKYGKDYVQQLSDPAGAVQSLRDRKDEKRDMKVCRKLFFVLMDLFDEFDLEDAERRLALRSFQNPLSVVPEAESYFTFNSPEKNVKPAEAFEEENAPGRDDAG